jgi:5-methylthioadenosine/S-adenosylhomocysteine deaminase
LAFDEMLAAGITTVAEFFYLNGAGNAHAREAIRAAADSGIRLVFARTWMDAGYAPDAFRESIDAARERTLSLMTEFPAVHICVAPHSLHAASPDMIREAARFAQSQDCMMHVHVAEAQYEGEETARRFGTTPIRLLERLEALNERTLAIHAIYITGDEKQLLAQTGAGVIHNPTTNQYLGDGICDVCGLQALGVPMGLGTDADVSPSAIDEMRGAALLQKIARLDGSALGARNALDLGTRQGARALRVNAGRLAPESFADFTVIDVTHMDPWIPLCNQIVYRSQGRDVRETFVGGRLVRSRHQESPAGAKQAVSELLPLLHL